MCTAHQVESEHILQWLKEDTAVTTCLYMEPIPLAQLMGLCMHEFLLGKCIQMGLIHGVPAKPDTMPL